MSGAAAHAELDLAAMANSLRLIGHPSRLAVVFHLLKGPCLVSELESELNLHQPNLSQHLSILRDANILTSQRQAKTVLYALKEGATKNIIGAIHGKLDKTAGNESHHPQERPASTTMSVLSAPLDECTPRHNRSNELDDASVFAQVLPPSRG